MQHYEKTLASQRIYEGKIINLRRDTIELPNGNQSTREVVEHPGGVAVLAVDDEDNILFVTQYRYPYAKELLEIPAGKRDHGENEDPALCGMRELEEETGYRAKVFLPLGELYPTAGYVDEVIYLYYATDLLKTEQHLDEDEFLSVQKIPAQKAYEMVLNGEIPDAKTQIAVLKYMALRAIGKL